MISLKWYTGKSKQQGQKTDLWLLGIEVEREVEYKKATWVNLKDYGKEYTFVKTHRLNKKTNKYKFECINEIRTRTKLLKATKNFKKF